MMALVIERLLRLRQSFNEYGIEAMVINSPENMYYLSGFDGGEGMVVVTEGEQYILTDSRFTTQVEAECPHFTPVIENGPQFKALAQLLAPQIKVGFEANRMIYDNYRQLHQQLGDRLVPVTGAVEKLRQIKDQTEIGAIRRAVEAGDRAFAETLPLLSPGLSEKQAADLIESGLKKAGCLKPSFDTIAVSGERSAMPHGRPGGNNISGEMFILDFGGFYDFYAGDMTRTLAVNGVSPRLYDLYNKVLEAQMRAIEKVGPGVPCKVVDEQARDCLKKYGLAEYFGHGTGHGVGLEIHERPTVSYRSEEVLKPGMVVTIEPGVYIPGWGGIRIEDVVLVTERGHEVMTRTTKELLSI